MTKQIIIGLTGQFGSGCTTLKEILCDKYHFTGYSFSNLIKAVANTRHISKPTRSQLQDIGNEFRQKDSAYWAKKLINRIKSNSNKKTHYVIDGFRNTFEIKQFRSIFPKTFYLVAINAEDKEIRWQRQKHVYDSRKLLSADFDVDDARDSGERFNWGQQVTKCIGEADIILDNTKQYYFPSQTMAVFIKKIRRYIEILTGKTKKKKWSLSPAEKCMYLAYKFGEFSPCTQRHVGAVIFRKKDIKKPFSYGYNSPPFIDSCEYLFSGCHKEQTMHALWEKMWTWVEGKKCPKCKKVLKNLQQNFYYCSTCKFDMKTLVMPTKGSDHCVAIHAEDMAISNANKSQLKDTILFTTTFPCLQCSLKIIYSKISHIYYVDPYPLPETKMIKDELFKKNVSQTQFEGIKNTKIIERLLNQ